MEKEITKIFSMSIKDTKGILLSLSKESASIYNKSKETFWNKLESDKVFLSAIDIQKEIYKQFNNNQLGSNSVIGTIQKFSDGVKSYFKSLKGYNKNPSKFSGKPNPPKEDKIIYPIIFKDTSIRIKNNRVILSLFIWL